MKIRRTALSFLVALAVATAALPAQQAQRVLTPDVIITIAQVADAQISPDGAQVVYQVSRPRAESDPPGGARAELWMVPAAAARRPSRRCT